MTPWQIGWDAFLWQIVKAEFLSIYKELKLKMRIVLGEVERFIMIKKAVVCIMLLVVLHSLLMPHLCLTVFLASTPTIIFQDQSSFFKMICIPFTDLRTTWGIGIGVFSGSGISSKRSSVRASAVFSSFMANCCPMQFLTRKGREKTPLCYTQYKRRLVDIQNK